MNSYVPCRQPRGAGHRPQAKEPCAFGHSRAFHVLPMEYHSRVVSISEIDTADASCCLSLKAAPGALVASMGAVGLINPPVLAQKRDETYRIICGFRRVKACQVLGRRKIRAHVVGGDHSELDLLKLAVVDNQSHRPLNVIEQARGIRKLSPHLPSKGRLEALASLLGFPPNKRVFEKIMAMDGLPEAIQAGVLEETVSFEAATHLAGLSHGDGLSFFGLLKGLKLSQNKQIEIITLVQEIAIREDLQVEDVLQSKDVTTVMDRPDLNRNEKAAALRALLKRRRFPSLTQMEAEFSAALKVLKLTKEISITPPPYFEGGPYVLRMTFKNRDDFFKGSKILEGIAKNPALKRVLER